MNVEDRIRDLLAHDADTVADIPGWPDIEARISRRSHRPKTLPVVAAILAVVVIAIGIAVWPSESSIDVVAAGAPRSFVGATRDEITERSTTDGTVKRTILRADPRPGVRTARSLAGPDHRVRGDPSSDRLV